MERIRLLIGITLSQLGGAQRVVQEIIHGLPENDYDIVLVTHPNGELVSWAKDLSASRDFPIKMVELDSSRREINPRSDYQLYCDLRRIIREHSIQVAHFHSSKMGIVGRAAAASMRVPRTLFTVHGWGINSFQRPIVKAALGGAERLCGKMADEIICVCEADRLVGLRQGWIPRGKGIVIYNGMPDTSAHRRTGNLRNELGIPDAARVIGTVARLTEQKAPEFLISLAHDLLKRGKDFHTVIVGDGPLEAICRQKLKEMGLSDRIHLLGARKDIPAILPEFDVFVLLSKWEGLPLTIIEAMFAGLPVVASDVGGVKEVVSHEVTGYLVPPIDDGASLARVSALLEAPELCVKMGRAGRENAKKLFTVQRMVSQYDQAYRSQIGLETVANL